MLTGIALLSVSSCGEDNFTDEHTSGDTGVNVAFEVSVAQENQLASMLNAPTAQAAFARRATQGLQGEGLATRRLEVQGLPNTCLVETATEGINAVLPQPGTRANVKTAIDAQFSLLGYRSTTANFKVDRPEWFHSVAVSAKGALVKPQLWAWAQRYARFYAVFPEATTAHGITLSPATYSGTPYVDFEVKQNIADQVDLMVASSGEVVYETRGTAPKAHLEFHHALTAVKFAVGQDLSWNKHITKVELRNVCSKGRLHFADNADGKGLHWEVDAASKTNFTLDLGTPGISTSSMPNQVLVGKDGDNYTFYMIPQPMDGITLHVAFSDAPAIDIPLSGTWKPAATYTQKLCSATSSWDYTFTVTRPNIVVGYNATDGGTYTVESFRVDPSAPGVKHAVSWQIVGYEEFNYATNTWVDKGMNKPDWFDGLPNVRTQTEDYVAADQGQIAVQKMEIKDLLKAYNDQLKEGAKGSSADYYDLSTHNIKGTVTPRNTANCYVISHPGYYKLPLVYGNAITNGMENAASYTGPSTVVKYNNTDVILHKFKDHADADITNAWIEKTHGGANSGIDGAQIVWEDEKDLVHFDANPIERSGGETYLKFEVKASDIKNGNAVVAVKKGNTIVWSWHLWFAPDNVLDPIPVVNYSGSHTYKFSAQPLGWKYTALEGSVSQQPRRVKVRIRQEGSHQLGDIVITQNPGNVKQGSSTHYQFGRKDAFPGGLKGNVNTGNAVEPTLYPADHLFNKNAGERISLTNTIQHPGNFYIRGTGKYWCPDSYNDPAGFAYFNIWSTQNTTWEVYNVGNDNPVVKSIYDPSPVGFHLPASNAFTRFSITGKNSNKADDLNVKGAKVPVNLVADYGWNFFTDASNTSTIFFPAAGYRFYEDGSVKGANTVGSYWSAVPNNASGGFYFAFNWQVVQPLSTPLRCLGASVRPVME